MLNGTPEVPPLSQIEWDGWLYFIIHTYYFDNNFLLINKKIY
jgi:hypothetical protein